MKYQFDQYLETAYCIFNIDKKTEATSLKYYTTGSPSTGINSDVKAKHFEMS